MKELWGFIAPVNLGGSNSSRRLPTWEVLLTRSLQGAETLPPRDKFGGVGGDAKKRPGGLVSVGWRGCGEIPSGSAVLLPLGSGEGTSHVPSCTRASPHPAEPGIPPQKGFGKSQKDFPPPLPSALLSSLA